MLCYVIAWHGVGGGKEIQLISSPLSKPLESVFLLSGFEKKELVLEYLVYI
jgi:hypothetical protein